MNPTKGCQAGHCDEPVRSTGIEADHWHCVDIFFKIRSGEPSGFEGLRRAYSKGVRFLLQRQFGTQDLDDQVHEVLTTVMTQIREGDLKEPERLIADVRTATQRHILKCLGERTQAHQESSPRDSEANQNNEELALRVLNAMDSHDRDALIRFYLHGQQEEQICKEMGLTASDFRLLKSRTKSHFGDLLTKNSQPRKGPGSWRKYLPFGWLQTA